MKMRTTQPSDNKYYIRKANGGYNGAVKGKPTIKDANVLCNCVGYANGRFAEIIGEKKIQYQLVCNAENFIEKAKKYGLKISDVPVLGGIMVWQKGKTLSDDDGAGHVAVVEKIVTENKIITSESGYNSFAFKTVTRTNANGRWGIGSAYKFRGCIVNPAIGMVTAPTQESKPSISEEKAKYKVLSKSGMFVRKSASTSAKAVGTLVYGAIFSSSKKSGDWVYADDKKGWVCIKQGSDVYLKKV